jgi:hypothetical protein
MFPQHGSAYHLGLHEKLRKTQEFLNFKIPRKTPNTLPNTGKMLHHFSYSISSYIKALYEYSF